MGKIAGAASAGGGGGQVILRAEGQVGNHVTAKLGTKIVEGIIPEGGVLQLKLPGLGLWEVDTESKDSNYHFTQGVKLYRYGITPCLAIAKKKFADCTPAEIQLIARNHLCEDFWQIGDEKKITMENGEEIYVQPYGFDHDYVTLGGEAKLPLTLGMKDCFNTTYRIQSEANTIGGWSNSEFRNKSIPTILENFPSEWRDIMTPCEKAHYYGGGGYTAGDLVHCVDTLFLLSEMEFFGKRIHGRPAGNNDTQYPIFTDDSSRIKHKGISGGPCNMWTRSIAFDNSGGSGANSNVYVTTTGTSLYTGLTNDGLGVALAFCVG